MSASLSPLAPVIIRSDEWSLDLLGNWVGGAAAGTTGPPDGRIIAGDIDWGGAGYSPPRRVQFAGVTPDAVDDTFRFMQLINGRNEIEQLDLDLDTGTMDPVEMQYDAAGNLEFDGQYYYQYDAWNRLIQVNFGYWVSEAVVIGDIVKHYTYDGQAG